MHVKLRDIHPSLRIPGAIVRLLPPAAGKRMLRWGNRLCDAVIAGHAWTRRSLYRQEHIARPDGSLLRLAIYEPREVRGPLAAMLWLHGGGYALGVPEIDVHFADMFTALGCAVVMPDYTRSADAPYPAAFDDCCLALRWMRDHAEELHAASDQLFVGGDSAGGGLAAAVCLHARDRGDVAVAAQFPLYPMLDDRPTRSSRDNDAPVWNTAANEAAWKMYLRGVPEVPAYAAPGRCRDYRDLPPALTFVGSLDPFLTETTGYIAGLQAAGVQTCFKIYDGCFHGFDILFGRSRPGREARLLLRNGVAYARRYFRKAQPGEKQT